MRSSTTTPASRAPQRSCSQAPDASTQAASTSSSPTMSRTWRASGTVPKIRPRTRNDAMPWWSSSVASGSARARARTSLSVTTPDRRSRAVRDARGVPSGPQAAVSFSSRARMEEISLSWAARCAWIWVDSSRTASASW